MKVTPRQDVGPRLYHGRGFCVPSVTEVLSIVEKRYLEAWRSRVGRQEADRVRSNAALIGTKVHAIAQTLTWERKAKVSADMELYALAIRSFLNAHVARPLQTELSLVSERERVGGTLDLYCLLSDGTYAVVDYKTSAQLSREHGLQTALYALLLREHGYEVNKRIVVRIKKDVPGEWYARSYGDHAGDVKAARACVEIWHWLHRNKLLKAMEAARNSAGSVASGRRTENTIVTAPTSTGCKAIAECAHRSPTSNILSKTARKKLNVHDNIVRQTVISEGNMIDSGMNRTARGSLNTRVNGLSKTPRRQLNMVVAEDGS